MRYLYVAAGLLVLIGALAGTKVLQITKLINMGKAMEAMGPPPEAVGTIIAQRQDWDSTINAIGNISAATRVAVSNEAPGVVARIHFESGTKVRAGQILLELDAKVERAQLAAIKARIDLAKINASRSEALLASSSVSEARVDSDQSALKTAMADAAALQAQIARKTVRAPFAGKLGIRLVNLGQYLNPGTPITSLESMDSVFADFSVPQQRLGDLKPGTPVRISVESNSDQNTSAPIEKEGTISALSPEIDANTRSVKVRASIPNDDNKLRSGMFVQVSVVLPTRTSVIAIPSPAVIHASFGDSVFVVEPLKNPATQPKGSKPVKVARQQFVRLGPTLGDFVAVEDGLAAGQEIVFAGAFKLRNGAKIIVDNTAQASPRLNPNPNNSVGLEDTPSP